MPGRPGVGGHSPPPSRQRGWTSEPGLRWPLLRRQLGGLTSWAPLLLLEVSALPPSPPLLGLPHGCLGARSSLKLEGTLWG